MRVGVGIHSINFYIEIFLFGYILYLYFGLFLAQKHMYARRCIL